MEKAMAAHSSTLAWKIPWTEEPGGPQSMGSWRVRHDWATSLSLFPFMHWRRKWQPTPVFLPGESQARGSLVGCHLRGRTESDTTEAPQQQQQQRRSGADINWVHDCQRNWAVHSNSNHRSHPIVFPRSEGPAARETQETQVWFLGREDPLE